MRFLLKKDEVSALRPFKRFTFELLSFLSAEALVVDRLRFAFGLNFTEDDLLPLIIEIDGVLEFVFSSVFCLVIRPSTVVDKECLLLAPSLRVLLDAGTSRVEWRREYSSKVLS